MKKPASLQEATTQVMGAAWSDRIGQAFAAMDVAEKEIKRAKSLLRAPAKRKRVEQCFRYLVIPSALRGKTMKLYQAHAREMVRRAAEGEDMRPATSAEMLVALSESSLKAPLNAAGCRLMHVCFVAVFGHSVDGEPPGEAYPGQMAELEHELRRKAGDPNRGVLE